MNVGSTVRGVMARLPDFTPLGLRPGFPQFQLVQDATVADVTYARIRCPRCGEEFMVKWTVWVATRTVNTRSCTYCFKVSALPKEAT